MEWQKTFDRPVRQIDATLQQKAHDLQTVTDILAGASKDGELQGILREALRKIGTAVDAEAIGIFVLDEKSGEMRQFAVTPGAGSSMKTGKPLDIRTMPAHRHAVQSGRCQVIPDARALPEGITRSSMHELGLRSALVVPMMLRGRALGTLDLVTVSGPRYYTTEQVSLVQALSGHLASIVENGLLHERTEKERAWLESIVAGIGEGLVIMDRDKNIKYFNRAAEQILGLCAQDFVGQSGEVLQAAMARRLNNSASPHPGWVAATLPGQTSKIEYEFTSGDTRQTIETILFAVADKENRLGTGILFRDITREREVDRIKTQFISLASHELRSPLTAILGFSELLLQSGLDAKEQESSLRYIHRESLRLTSILDYMLSISRIEAGALSLRLHPLSLNELIQEVLSDFVTLYPGRRFKYADATSDEVRQVLADKDKLGQVLRNLIDNAVKYSPDEAAVEIFARRDEQAQRVVVSIKDRGIGIPEDEMPRLFTRFHRVKSPETAAIQGSGLGLYIVRSLVELMEGTVWAESKAGAGSTFSFALRLPTPTV